MHQRTRLWIAVVILAALGVVTVPAQEGAPDDGPPGRGVSAEEVSPAHNLQTVSVLRTELELIRLEMGKPEGQRALLRVEKAAPREVYFQALAFFRKANRLAFEHTRKKVQDPGLPSGTIRPREVRQLLERAGERLNLVKSALGIDEVVEVPALQEGVEPTQVFAAIVNANRAINDLLDQRFAPADVFEQLTIAIAYTSRLLEATGQITSPPEPLPYERRKRPADVYRRLLECFQRIHRIAELSDAPILRLVDAEAQVEGAVPSDVYDLSALLVAELAYFHNRLPAGAEPRRVYNPGRKVPAHVYQRAGILLQQLDTLVERVRENPHWLGEQNESRSANP